MDEPTIVAFAITSSQLSVIARKWVERTLAIELMAAAQGINFRREIVGESAKMGNGTQPVFELIRENVPFIEQDTVLYRYMEAVRQLIISQEVRRVSSAL